MFNFLRVKLQPDLLQYIIFKLKYAGRLDTALVVSTNMQLCPSNMRLFQELGMCSSRGVSAPLDGEADGFVKSEVVGCLLLKRRANARRVYAAIRAVRVNNDVYKMVGMFHPSGAAHEALIRLRELRSH